MIQDASSVLGREIRPVDLAIPGEGVDARLLQERFGDVGAEEALRLAIREIFPGRVAIVSSFGADSVALLHLAAQVAPETPVIFLDTGHLFPETLAYRDAVIARLGLTDVRSIQPDPADLAQKDEENFLWASDPDGCCHIRKVLPLAKALRGFDAWISGRKAFQAATRAALPMFEADSGRVKINPLVRWTGADIKAYLAQHDLPRHPLVAQGYPSIGCIPCTSKIRPGEDERAGRWRGRAKTECGIHAPVLVDGEGI
ncbi:phosphoadenylyl-sulfate reductase [Methylovirgula sp. 4M-Z18]|uniref:phosphoadenylyl-sulfate reductase n=1 Tax=Methylovirgula sp. 4M-Z18 TaxID=2293567 RepID=UPI000E2F919D|nr:phosphoadenylyl-sulfate reductase [Methylovirgula sp. 4M-Z18]RFB79654.1 phosphoadenylyl-sulfate reductase [Methylovirgula sp. 4M-Z18]